MWVGKSFRHLCFWENMEGKEESIIIITIIELASVNNSPFRWNVETGGKTLNNKKIFHSAKFLLIKFM